MMIVERYVSQPLIDQAREALRRYRCAGDDKSRRALIAFGLQVLAGIAIEYGWEDARKDERPRGMMTACVEAAIDDACGKPPSVKALLWPELVHGKKWRPRYEALRVCLQELTSGEGSS